MLGPNEKYNCYQNNFHYIKKYDILPYLKATEGTGDIILVLKYKPQFICHNVIFHKFANSDIGD